ncbi:MAG: hypothetical protein WDM81_06530 [Rhizomicrobium sp.]
MVGRAPDVGEDEGLGEMREKLVQPQKLVALAHALAVAVDDDEDRAAAGLERIEDIAGQADGLVHPNRRPVRDADHQGAAAGAQRARSEQHAAVGLHVVAAGKQRGKNVIERHGRSSALCRRSG